MFYSQFTGENVSTISVLRALCDMIGLTTMTAYLHEYFGDEATFYPNPEKNGICEIALGDSKGWPKPYEVFGFMQFVVNKLEVIPVKNEYGYFTNANLQEKT